ncbi:hypothetical protein [Stieleria magnilauensis]|uniref:Glycosyltransferase RgtA/B/C/D-like domain-containing protein n=1 Tax=Stieleria magnilauensis TaxID=2527963 RepID=A0ABX5XKA6_9BACT|nr:hypothetical protein TBK1r_11220 [Planctomycetes bacterium TBK1r]
MGKRFATLRAIHQALTQSTNVADESTQAEKNEPNADASVGLLAVLAGLSICVYGIIAVLSWRFDFDSVTTDRPIIAVLGLFAVAFACYLGAIRIAWRTRHSARMLKLVIGSAIVFRVVMLFSLPIQEVDIYRYVWDGAVSTAGVSPFRYSPGQVNSAELASNGDKDLLTLAKMRDDDPALAEILNRVHFPELPTIYPPTSQAVFAAANLTTPSSSSVLTRVFIMKAWFIGLDIATLFVVIGLLRRCAKPIGLCVIYAWCPLLMKEVANSGHLDAIAVFLTTLGLYMVVRSINDKSSQAKTTLGFAVLAGFVLALAVGAKLYPIILAPLVFFSLAKKLGWRLTLAPALAFAVTTAVLISAMVPGERSDSHQEQIHDPSLGVVTFLRRWEMNDFLFLLLIENIKPTAQRGPHETAWFTVIPESVRETMVDSISARLDIDPGETPFMIARATTAFIFFVLAITLAWRTAAKDSASFSEAAFLTIAWFWLLCPTLNPWYWTWALPLLPFARGRAWLAVSGLVLIYYLRFWLDYHFPTTAVLGTRYTGVAFFDFVITWIEFAPWFVVLIVGCRSRSNIEST